MCSDSEKKIYKINIINKKLVFNLNAMADSSSFRRVTHSQRNKNLQKLFKAEKSDDDCVLDSSDDEYFPPSEAAASDCDDADDEIELINEDKDEEDINEESEDGEDEDEESEVEATGSGMTAKDSTQWAATSPSKHQYGRHNIVGERCGPNRNTNLLSNLDTFKLFFTPEMADIIIHHTNKKAISTYANYNEKNPEKKQLEWKNLELQEFYAFLAILITSGANNSNTDDAREMWQPYSYPLYRAAMSINRFWNIIRFIRFDDADTRAQRLESDKAAPIRDIWAILNSNLAKHYKAGVDTMDKMLGRYSTKRSTQRWPLAFFYNILDIACLAAFILYYENNKMLVKKLYERRLFYRQLGRELCTPFVESRSHNAQIIRHFSTKVAIESLLGRAVNPNAQPTSSVSLTPQTQRDSTGRKKITGVCYECLQSEFKKRRKTRKICSVCENPICDEHCITTMTCEGCTK